ncbi:MAG TPA: hypothetical protein VHB27_11840 [Rhodopila sp.]|uniref:hypothetical protein n=1 Tax=Rhodopila sp. TaxID=2480087 RepID=UPI002C33C481|nr:hypothetical protein [Rhodopila sp.]HVY15911.1 hypothetical protein [Rhodopila sp.]
MNTHRPPEIDMTPEGEFVDPPRPPILTRVMMWAIVVAVLAGALSIAAFALWLFLLLLPIALGAAAVAYGVFRFQAWRAQQSVGGQRNVWRP